MVKEAAGEANLTVIAIVLIGIVAAVATPLITRMMETSRNKSCCVQAGGDWKSNTCRRPTGINADYYDPQTYNNCIDAR